MAPENTGPEQVTTTTILLVLSTVFVGLRLWARYHVVAKYGLDDCLTVASLVFVWMIGGLNYGMVAAGMGRHASTVSLDSMTIVLKHLLAFECLYVTAIAAVKLSILAFYLRIFPSRGFRIASWLIGSTVVAWWIAIVLVCIFQCNPIRLAWAPWEAGVCINLRASFIGNAVPNILTDVAIMVMPIKQVWNLHAPLPQKLSLLGTFGLGSFVLIASIYRFSTIMEYDASDTTYTLATPCTWCVVESACGVICACLPTLRPLARLFSSKFASLSRSRGKSTGRGPTELVTIGRASSRGGAKSPFCRLADDDDEKKVVDRTQVDRATAKHSSSNSSSSSRAEATTASKDYASSGDAEGEREPTRTPSERRFV